MSILAFLWFIRPTHGLDRGRGQLGRIAYESVVVLNPWGKPSRLTPEFAPRIQDDHGLGRHKNPKIDIVADRD